VKPTWGLIAAATLLLVAGFVLSMQASWILDPYRAEAFAVQYANDHGLNWPVVEKNDYGNEWRYLLQNPDDRDQYADIRVRRSSRNEFETIQFNKDFRPWQGAVLSR